MKTAILTFAAAFCFVVSASAQNEVQGQPNNPQAPADENIHAPARMDRQNGTQTQQEQFDATDPQHKPEPGTLSNPGHTGQHATEGQKNTGRQINNSGTKPKSGAGTNRKAGK